MLYIYLFQLAVLVAMAAWTFVLKRFYVLTLHFAVRVALAVLRAVLGQ